MKVAPEWNRLNGCAAFHTLLMLSQEVSQLLHLSHSELSLQTERLTNLLHHSSELQSRLALSEKNEYTSIVNHIDFQPFPEVEKSVLQRQVCYKEALKKLAELHLMLVNMLKKIRTPGSTPSELTLSQLGFITFGSDGASGDVKSVGDSGMDALDLFSMGKIDMSMDLL